MMHHKHRIYPTGQRYSLVGDAEDHEENLQATKQILDLGIKLKQVSRCLHLSILLNTLLLLSLAGTYVVWMTDGWPFTMNLSFKRVNSYSALLDRFNVELHEAVTNSSIWDDGFIFKKLPSPEADAAWNRVASIRILTLTGDDLKRMGRNKDEAAKVPLEWARGDDLYPAFLDSQHLLHCLNEVRMYAWFPYYYEDKYGPGSNTMNMPPIHQAHLRHCLSVLLEAIRCQPSLNIDTFEYIDPEQRPFPEFRTKRKCMNHDALLDWQASESWISVDMLNSIKPRPETIIVGKPEGVSEELEGVHS